MNKPQPCTQEDLSLIGDTAKKQPVTTERENVMFQVSTGSAGRSRRHQTQPWELFCTDCLCPPNAHVEALTPSVLVFGGGRLTRVR